MNFNRHQMIKSKPQPSENKINKDPKNNPFFVRSNDSDGSLRFECEDEEGKLAESNEELSNSFCSSICTENYEKRIELELRHAESTIRAVNESAEEVQSVSSSEIKLLLKRKRQDDVNCSDKGADKRNRCKTPENKEILDIGGRSAPKLDGKGLLKALGTEILVQEDGVLNTRSKRKDDLKKLEYCSNVILTTLFFCVTLRSKRLSQKLSPTVFSQTGFASRSPYQNIYLKTSSS
ncbi:hypothetical protein C1646_815814 [Rhizophagus diaphanus]|nr:hypothetical protein C1646_815814 [Rhizophagus diaphanus] [Rhizophagus sp. MUCL 43196]